MSSNGCERARQLASSALDGELSELERTRLEGHVRACPACAHFQAQIGAVAAAVREAPLAAIRTNPVVRPHPRRGRGRGLGLIRQVPRVVAGAATAVLLLGSATLLGVELGARSAPAPVADTGPASSMQARGGRLVVAGGTIRWQRILPIGQRNAAEDF